MEEAPSSHYTPSDICKQLLEDITFNEDDNTLEPCKGRDGNFYNLIPYKKMWTEIDLGRDLFTYDFGETRFTKIVTNPPYMSNHINKNERVNIAIKVIEKCFELSSDECWFLLNNQMMNSITPARLRKYKELGFAVIYMRILNIPRWYGRYTWCCFKKNGVSIIQY
tara:strand:+ start:142 stop:639 length:498 start_codon:yes stop_codon:yes gene_type:complete